MSLYRLHGTKWSVIARQIPGRTDDACSKRYREALDPALKKDEWTETEDAKLLQLYGQLGGKWVQVGQQLQRSSLGCRNRSAWRPSRVSFLCLTGLLDGDCLRGNDLQLFEKLLRQSYLCPVSTKLLPVLNQFRLQTCLPRGLCLIHLSIGLLHLLWIFCRG
jgi:hypothetical protein